MSPKFGTSGLRGLVLELSRECVSRYVQAFVISCRTGAGLYVGYDLRPSSKDLADIVAQAASNAGLAVTLCGEVPTPALALAAMEDGASAIMVTGSHIPADRNGLKFYTPLGEITKAEEGLIQNALNRPISATAPGIIRADATVPSRYAARYYSAFEGALTGLRVGLYAHSAVGREELAKLLRSLGADVVPLGWSKDFVPVDTEAVPDDLRQKLLAWAVEHDVDAIASTDADGDRPMLTDENGEVVPGDILGQITAGYLGAETVVTPISSNSGAELSSRFVGVLRTPIGSPHVIAGMQKSGGKVVGYEANGGFLLGFAAQGASGVLSPLTTRDAVLPICAVLAQSAETGVAAIVRAQPARFTETDRLQDIDLDAAKQFLQQMCESDAKAAAFLAPFGCKNTSKNSVDGLRFILEDERIIHLRPSGNAPEMRLYVEADSRAVAVQTHRIAMSQLRHAFLQSATSESL